MLESSKCHLDHTWGWHYDEFVYPRCIMGYWSLHFFDTNQEVNKGQHEGRPVFVAFLWLGKQRCNFITFLSKYSDIAYKLSVNLRQLYFFWLLQFLQQTILELWNWFVKLYYLTWLQHVMLIRVTLFAAACIHEEPKSKFAILLRSIEYYVRGT